MGLALRFSKSLGLFQKKIIDFIFRNTKRVLDEEKSIDITQFSRHPPNS
jgi:hypothetical protein